MLCPLRETGSRFLPDILTDGRVGCKVGAPVAGEPVVGYSFLGVDWGLLLIGLRLRGGFRFGGGGSGVVSKSIVVVSCSSKLSLDVDSGVVTSTVTGVEAVAAVLGGGLYTDLHLIFTNVDGWAGDIIVPDSQVIVKLISSLIRMYI